MQRLRKSWIATTGLLIASAAVGCRSGVPADWTLQRLSTPRSTFGTADSLAGEDPHYQAGWRSGLHDSRARFAAAWQGKQPEEIETWQDSSREEAQSQWRQGYDSGFLSALRPHRKHADHAALFRPEPALSNQIRPNPALFGSSRPSLAPVTQSPVSSLPEPILQEHWQEPTPVEISSVHTEADAPTVAADPAPNKPVFVQSSPALADASLTSQTGQQPSADADGFQQAANSLQDSLRRHSQLQPTNITDGAAGAASQLSSQQMSVPEQSSEPNANPEAAPPSSPEPSELPPSELLEIPWTIGVEGDDDIAASQIIRTRPWTNSSPQGPRQKPKQQSVLEGGRFSEGESLPDARTHHAGVGRSKSAPAVVSDPSLMRVGMTINNPFFEPTNATAGPSAAKIPDQQESQPAPPVVANAPQQPVGTPPRNVRTTPITTATPQIPATSANRYQSALDVWDDLAFDRPVQRVASTISHESSSASKQVTHQTSVLSDQADIAAERKALTSRSIPLPTRVPLRIKR